jgi:hypothetical protein
VRLDQFDGNSGARKVGRLTATSATLIALACLSTARAQGLESGRREGVCAAFRGFAVTVSTIHSQGSTIEYARSFATRDAGGSDRTFDLLDRTISAAWQYHGAPDQFGNLAYARCMDGRLF